MADTAWPYETTANVKAILGISDASKDGVIAALLLAVSESIDQYCNRTFVSYTATQRTYDAPASAVLSIDDAWGILSVTLDGTALASTEWVAGTTDRAGNFSRTPLFYTNTNQYTHLLRTDTGGDFPRAWTHRGAYSTVAVTANHGFSAFPKSIIQACQIMTCRLFLRATAGYSNESGLTASGMQTVIMPKGSLDADCRTLLKEYRRTGPVRSRPAWEEA